MTEWDLSTATYEGKSFSLSGQVVQAASACFDISGQKFWTITYSGINDKIHQYSLSTPWDVSTLSYDEEEFNVNAQDSEPHGLFFKPDGSKFFVLGNSTSDVFRYSCSKNWSISGASYDTNSYDTSTQGTENWGIFFRPNGLAFYLVKQVTNAVYQYSMSTAWDLTSSAYVDTYSVSGQTGASATGIYFKDDGTKMYVAGSSANDKVYQYSLSTAWDITTATYDNVSLNVQSEEAAPMGLSFKTNGTKCYACGTSPISIFQYDMPATPTGTNTSVNIGDAWKDISDISVNIGDAWKVASAASVNIGDSWKTIW